MNLDGIIVKLDGVTKTYNEGQLEVTAVNNLSLELKKGEFTVICGPSGSGKTTILNMLGGLDLPSSGKLFLEGREIEKLSRSKLSEMRRDRIGFVFQAYNLMPVLTAYENAEFVLNLQGRSEEEKRVKVMKVLADVGLGGMEDRMPNELSGGQQQRVAIARAIVTEPAIVLADEPTANVDSATADSLLDVMEKLNKEEGVTFLFSTHDQRVMDRARRIIRIKDGKLDSDVRK